MDFEIVIAIVVSVIMFFVYLPGVSFLFGKGGIAVAGYHFEPKNEKAKVYHKYIMRRLGIWYILLIALLHACVVCGILKQMTACYVLLGLFVAHSIFGLVWFHKNPKMKNAREMERKLDENPEFAARNEESESER